MYKCDLIFFVNVPAGINPAEMVERMNKNNIKAILLYVAGNVAFIVVSFKDVEYLKTVEVQLDNIMLWFFIAYNITLLNKNWDVLYLKKY